jgi:hypothetical protein
MPTPRRPDPEPLEADDVTIVTVGTVLWAVALVASLVFHDRLADGGNGNWIWIFLAGTFLGLIGIRYVRRRRAAIRREMSKFGGIGPRNDG